MVVQSIINTKEGWLESDNNEDEKNLKAAIWNRNDRHKLLVLVLEQPVLEMSAMCYCYDYDPETRKLRPPARHERIYRNEALWLHYAT